jgi:hypothetical protein
MIKKISVLSMLAFSTFSANSATYQVNVVLNVERAPIEITQTQNMAFSELLVNEASQNGFSCMASDVQVPNPTNRNLCPGTWTGKNARFIVSGTPRAAISYTFTGEPQEKDGLVFSIPGSGTTRNGVLDTNGQINLGTNAIVSLVDKDIAINSPGTKTFTYDFVAAYQ